MLLHRGGFARRNFYTQTPWHTVFFYIKMVFAQKKRLHTDAFTHRGFMKFLCTQAFTHRCCDTERFLHRGPFTHRLVYTKKPSYRVVFGQMFYTEQFLHSRSYVQKPLHRVIFTHRKLCAQTPLHTHTHTHMFLHKEVLHGQIFTHRRLYTQKPLHTDVFTHRSFYTEKKNIHTQKLLHRGVLAQRPFYTQRVYTQFFLQWQTVTQSCIYTEVLTQSSLQTYIKIFCAKKIRKDAFTHRSHRSLYTETLWRTEVDAQKLVHAKISTQMHKNVLSQSNFYTHFFLQTEKPFHRNRFSQNSFYTFQKQIFTSVGHVQPWFRANRLRQTFQHGNFAQVFDIRPASRAKRLHRTFRNRNFNRGFWCLTLIWCTKQKQNSHFTTLSGPPTAPANPNFTTRLGVRRAQSLQMLAQGQVFSHLPRVASDAHNVRKGSRVDGRRWAGQAADGRADVVCRCFFMVLQEFKEVDHAPGPA